MALKQSYQDLLNDAIMQTSSPEAVAYEIWRNLVALAPSLRHLRPLLDQIPQPQPDHWELRLTE